MRLRRNEGRKRGKEGRYVAIGRKDGWMDTCKERRWMEE